MTESVRSELRKLFTVRSTYVIMAICLAIVIFVAFYLQGYRQTADVTFPGLIAGQITGATSVLSALVAITGILLMTHEYRYNTIMYTLTASRSRTTTLLAKIIVISLFAVLLTLLIGLLSALFTYLGLHAKGLNIVAQDIAYADILWRVAFYGWAYSMIALIISVLVRNQVGTFAAFLLFPAIGETLLTLLLQQNAKYLPFTALGNVLNSSSGGTFGMAPLTPGSAATVVLLYIVIGWIIAWYVFLKRDAN